MATHGIPRAPLVQYAHHTYLVVRAGDTGQHFIRVFAPEVTPGSRGRPRVPDFSNLLTSKKFVCSRLKLLPAPVPPPAWRPARVPDSSLFVICKDFRVSPASARERPDFTPPFGWEKEKRKKHLFDGGIYYFWYDNEISLLPTENGIPPLLRLGPAP